jgi:hypothetical protein
MGAKFDKFKDFMAKDGGKELLSLGLGIYGGKTANDGMDKDIGYQGGISNLDFLREQVPDAMNMKGTDGTPRRAGGAGQRYFSDFYYSPYEDAKSEEPVRQALFDQAKELRQDNYNRARSPGGSKLEVPELTQTGPTGIASIRRSPLDYSRSTEGDIDYTPKDPDEIQFFSDGNVYVPGYGYVNLGNTSDILNFSNVTGFSLGDLTTAGDPPAGEGEDPPGEDPPGEGEDPAGEGGDPPGEGEDPLPRDPSDEPDENLPPGDTGIGSFGTRYDGEDFTKDQYDVINRDTGKGSGDLDSDGAIDSNEWLLWMTNKGFSTGVKADGSTYEADWKRRIQEAINATDRNFPEATKIAAFNAIGIDPETMRGLDGFIYGNLGAKAAGDLVWRKNNPEEPSGESAPENNPPSGGIQELRYDGQPYGGDPETVDNTLAFLKSQNVDGDEDGAISRDEWLSWMVGKGATPGFENEYKDKLRDAMAAGGISDETRDAAEAKLTSYAGGGIASLSNGYAAGGNIVGRYLSGATDGMADKIPASIDGSQRAALSDGEFVLPADVVSHFGNGNSDAGANALYNMMAKVRKDRTGNASQGNQINPSSYLPS